MAIKKIKLSNFKSFRDMEINLGKFNVLIGANASGKSNFIQIFRFLKDIKNFGLDNAISMQGGIEYLRNMNIGSSDNFSLEVISDQVYMRPFMAKKPEKKFIRAGVYETIYNFTIKFRKRGLGVETEEQIVQKFNIEVQQERIGKEKKKEIGEITISKINGKINVVPSKLPNEISTDDIIPPFLTIEQNKQKSLLLERVTSFIMPPIFSDISIYDFDPKIIKRATPITGKAELEEDGSNLAIILKNIIENKENKRKFFNLVQDLLPFVDNLNVEKFVDKSLFFKLKETYSKKEYLPASLISDGTVNIIALIIALYFEKKPITIIEEPERNIHPYLISKVVEMMKDVTTQVIVTTHNPEIVKHAGLENILLISRDKNGFSVISKPQEKEDVKIFLENELGIEELYVQNLLGSNI
ncbi:MAG TPA: AAA family ATPase [bacterium]|nr:AAA family ATPase [bacterium]